MPDLRRALLLIAAASLGVAGLHGRGLDAAEERPVAWRAARIVVTPDRSVAPGWLVVRGRTVEAVLADGEAIPEGADRRDLGDAVILPGFVSPLSAISEASYRAGNAPPVVSVSAGGPGDARARTAKAALRPKDVVWRRLGRTGYAAFGWLPDTGGLLAGQPAVVRPATRESGKSPEDLVLAESTGLLASFEAGKAWREAMEREFGKASQTVAAERQPKPPAPKEAPAPAPGQAPAPQGGPQPGPQPTPQPPPQPTPTPQGAQPQAAPGPPQAQAPPAPPDPLVQAFRGEIPLLVRIPSPAALDHFFRAFDRLPVRPDLILVLPPLPPFAVEKLAARRAGIRAVIVEPRSSRVPETSVLASAPRLFLERGFDVALVPAEDSLEGHAGMLLRLAELSKCGVSQRDLLAAVTTSPARILGLAGKVGVLEKGAAASFSAWSGDPFSGTARRVRCVVEGVEVYAEDPATGTISGEAIR